MKRMIIIFLFAPMLAMAAGYSGASGTNKLGEVVVIGDDAYELYVMKNKNDSILKSKEQYDFRKECQRYSKDDANFITCKPNSKSPLSGTTYKTTTSKKYHPCDDPTFNGTVYVCIKGCNNTRAPKIFYEKPWEC